MAADIARHHNANLDQLRSEVQLSQQAMELRSEDKGPPRTSETQSSPPTTAPTTVVPSRKGYGVALLNDPSASDGNAAPAEEEHQRQADHRGDADHLEVVEKREQRGLAQDHPVEKG